VWTIRQSAPYLYIKRHPTGAGVIKEAYVKSPCIDICKFDKKTGWCVGCGRSKDDCKEWKKASKKRLKEIKHDLPRRLEKLEERGKRVS
jgi:predicted Fe-S protein YdhL (DUF1289 family)